MSDETGRLIKTPLQGACFGVGRHIEVELNEDAPPEEFKTLDIAVLKFPDGHTEVEQVGRLTHTFSPQLFKRAEGEYTLTVHRFHVPKKTPIPKAKLSEIVRLSLGDRSALRNLIKGITPVGQTDSTSFYYGNRMGVDLNMQPISRVVLSNTGLSNLSIADIVRIAVVGHQADLFKKIRDELTPEIDSELQKEYGQGTSGPAQKKAQEGRLLFTGLRAYEILEKSIDLAMMRYLAFAFDVDQIAGSVESACQGLDIPSLIQSGKIEKRILDIAKENTKTYFDRLAVPAQSSARALAEYYDRIFKLRALGSTASDQSSEVGERSEDPWFDLDRKEWRPFKLERLNSPALCELMWSYWHEEGMLVQTMHAMNLRFQNKTQHPGADRLATLNTSPLRPLSNLIWGYIQREPWRLSVRRRNYEYDHHYGISLHGKAVLDFTPADSRRTFTRAFHRLLNTCLTFYKQLDDNTVTADAFPVKNALRDVHLVLSEGAHNQYGDLPWTARKEMLTEQYILSMPELREFIGGRSMIPYREPWMENVDTMKRLQNWTDVSVEQFNSLARVGEQILLTIRFGDWNSPDVQVNRAFAWAAMLRPWVQEYVHSYDTVTGVDLRDARQVDDTMPSVHLRRRLEAQTGKAA